MVLESFKVPLIGDLTKGKEIMELGQEDWRIAPTINEFRGSSVKQGLLRVVSPELAKAVGFKESLKVPYSLSFKDATWGRQ